VRGGQRLAERAQLVVGKRRLDHRDQHAILVIATTQIIMSRPRKPEPD
jgi:hypothetical protein